MYKDCEKYKCYIVENGELSEIDPPEHWQDPIQCHHYVERKKLRKKPHLEKYQKLIFMHKDMNYDIDRRTKNFKTRWGIDLEKVVYLA